MTVENDPDVCVLLLFVEYFIAYRLLHRSLRSLCTAPVPSKAGAPGPKLESLKERDYNPNIEADVNRRQEITDATPLSMQVRIVDGDDHDAGWILLSCMRGSYERFSFIFGSY